MYRSLALRFAIRWVVSSLGLWIAASLLGPDRMSVGDGAGTVILAGGILALANMLIKPLLVVFSLAAIILTLGLFMLVVNGVMLMIVSWVYSPLYIKNFGVAVVAAIILGFVNFLVSQILEPKKK